MRDGFTPVVFFYTDRPKSVTQGRYILNQVHPKPDNTGESQPSDLTLLLNRMQHGDREAGEQAASVVYQELRRIASGLMHRERTGHTLSPTAVVHEAVIRLIGDAVFDKAPDRGFLFASAARAMREVMA